MIDELVRRARVAEERAKRVEVEKKTERNIDVRVAHAPRFRRAIFTLPRSAPIAFDDRDGDLTLVFEGDFELPETLARSRLAGPVEGVRVTREPSRVQVTMRLADGMKVRGFREDDSFTLDFSRVDGRALADAIAEPVMPPDLSREPKPAAPAVAGAPAAPGAPAAAPATPPHRRLFSSRCRWRPRRRASRNHPSL